MGLTGEDARGIQSKSQELRSEGLAGVLDVEAAVKRGLEPKSWMMSTGDNLGESGSQWSPREL